MAEWRGWGTEQAWAVLMEWRGRQDYARRGRAGGVERQANYVRWGRAGGAEGQACCVMRGRNDGVERQAYYVRQGKMMEWRGKRTT